MSGNIDWCFDKFINYIFGACGFIFRNVIFYNSKNYLLYLYYQSDYKVSFLEIFKTVWEKFLLLIAFCYNAEGKISHH